MKAKIKCPVPSWRRFGHSNPYRQMRGFWSSQYENWRRGAAPLGVPEAVWVAATTEGAPTAATWKAMAEANRLAPGCILANSVTARKLAEKMFLGRCLSGSEAAQVMRQIRDIVLPHKPKGKAGGLNWMHVCAYGDVYCDVLVVRNVYSALVKGRQYDTAMTMVEAIFPDLKELSREKRSAIVGHGCKKDPKTVAAEIVGDAIGYKPDSVIDAAARFPLGFPRNYARDKARMIMDALAENALDSERFADVWGESCPKCHMELAGEVAPITVRSEGQILLICRCCGARL